MSSHLFEEVERTCERTAIIRRGQIAAVEDMEGLKKKRSRDYIITLDSKKSADALQLPGYTITGREGAQRHGIRQRGYPRAFIALVLLSCTGYADPYPVPGRNLHALLWK